MAVKSKTQLSADIAASTFSAPQQVILDDMVDSYEDLSQPLTTVQIAAIATPSSGQLVYNTDTSQFEYYNGVQWVNMGYALGGSQTILVSLTSAQILDAWANQVQLVPAQGAGTCIISESAAVEFICGNTPYATNTDILIKHDTAGFADYQIKITDGIGSTEPYLNRAYYIQPALNVAGENTVLRDNKGLFFTIDTGNPTAGDGTLRIWLTYKVVSF